MGYNLPRRYAWSASRRCPPLVGDPLGTCVKGRVGMISQVALNVAVGCGTENEGTRGIVPTMGRIQSAHECPTALRCYPR